MGEFRLSLADAEFRDPTIVGLRKSGLPEQTVAEPATALVTPFRERIGSESSLLPGRLLIVFRTVLYPDMLIP